MEKVFVAFGNRAFFPPEPMAEARKEYRQHLESLEFKVDMLPETETKFGAIENEDEGDKFAEYVLANGNPETDGVIVSHPNFATEMATLAALKPLIQAGYKVLLQGHPDKMNQMGCEQRRDAFCGLFSTMDVLVQYRLPFVKFAPHVVSPGSDRWEKNIVDFANIVDGAPDPFVPIPFEETPETSGENVLDDMVALSIGARTSQFFTTRFNEIDAAGHGITVQTKDLSQLFYMMDNLKVTDKRYIAKQKELLGYTEFNLETIPVGSIDQLVRLGVSLDEMIEPYVKRQEKRGKKFALSLRCWTEMQEQRGISPCAIMSMLNRKYSTACEVDVGNAIMMELMRGYTKGPVACQDWNNNVGEGLDSDDKFAFMHCGPHDTEWLEEGHYVTDHDILKHADTIGEGKGYGCIHGRFKPCDFVYGSAGTLNGEIIFYVGVGKVTDDKLPEEYFGSAGIAEIKNAQDVYLNIGKLGMKHHFSMSRVDPKDNPDKIADKMIADLRQHKGYKVIDMRKAKPQAQ